LSKNVDQYECLDKTTYLNRYLILFSNGKSQRENLFRRGISLSSQEDEQKKSEKKVHRVLSAVELKCIDGNEDNSSERCIYSARFNSPQTKANKNRSQELHT